MVFDRIENAATYFKLSPRIETALRFLQRDDLKTLPLGRQELDGDRLFALVQEYQTKRPDETFWETHRKYIDVQYIVSGAEAMGYAPKQSMTLKADYDPQREVFVWTGQGHQLILSPGTFVIFHPHDAHMGGLIIDEPRPVRKVVLKLAVE
jgi:YhcH/YjgK/YiaL family protein